FDLACRDDQQRVRSTWVIGSGRKHGLQTRDRALEIFDGVKAASAIEACLMNQSTLRIRLNELSQFLGCHLILACAEAHHGLFISGLFHRIRYLYSGLVARGLLLLLLLV